MYTHTNLKGADLMKLYSVHYYDFTGAKGVASYDAANEIDARDQFLAQHPSCNVNYIKPEPSLNDDNQLR
jgi:hypothetical protein